MPVPAPVSPVAENPRLPVSLVTVVINSWFALTVASAPGFLCTTTYLSSPWHWDHLTPSGKAAETQRIKSFAPSHLFVRGAHAPESVLLTSVLCCLLLFGNIQRAHDSTHATIFVFVFFFETGTHFVAEPLVFSKPFASPS